jgi:putative FmdB family regulatory protein
MPLYDYVCENSHTKEIAHGMTDAPRMYCHCGKPLKKAVSAPVVNFKGEGFYSTDKK